MSGNEELNPNLRDRTAAEVAALEAETEAVIDIMGRDGRDLSDIRDDPDLNFRLGQISFAKKLLDDLDAKNVEQ